MQQPNERTPEFQGVDTRSWVSFSRLAERWERAHSLDRSDMLYEILQGYLRGELWPTILPEVYGGTAITASPARPDWMKSPRRWPVETFTRLDFLRAAKAFAGLHLYFLPESIKADEPYATGRRGLIGISLDKYSDLFIESYIKKLTPSPSAVVRWCSDHGWPIPPGLSYPETDIGAVGQDEHAGSQNHRADDANTPTADQKHPKRTRDVEADALLKNKIETVLTLARKEWPKGKKFPGVKPAARELVNKHRSNLKYKYNTVCKILDGTYPASRHLGIPGV